MDEERRRSDKFRKPAPRKLRQPTDDDRARGRRQRAEQHNWRRWLEDAEEEREEEKEPDERVGG